MNTRTALIALALVALLGALTLFSLRGAATPAPGPGPASAPALDPARVFRIEVTQADGAPASLTLNRSLDVWMLTVGSESPFPAQTGVARGLARLISDALAQASQPSPAPTPPFATLRLSLPGGTQRTACVLDTAVGGSVAVYEETPAGWLRRSGRADLAGLLRPAAIAQWREASVFPTLLAPPNRVLVESAGKRLELSRLRDRWAMIQPVSAPADADEVAKLLRALRGLSVQRWLSGDAAYGSSDTPPTATIRLWSSAGGASTARRAVVQSLIIDGPADSSGTAYFARSDASPVQASDTDPTSLWGPFPATVAAQAIQELVKPADTYISRRAVQTPGADVGRIALCELTRDLARVGQLAPPAQAGPRDVVLERTLSGWARSPQASAVQPPDGQASERVAAFIRLLCDTDAAGVMLSPPFDAELTPLALIILGSPNGAPLEALAACKWDPPDGATCLLLRVGGVWRVYSGSPALDAKKLLRELLPPSA